MAARRHPQDLDDAGRCRLVAVGGGMGDAQAHEVYQSGAKVSDSGEIVVARSKTTKQSSERKSNAGLPGGACHRARIRATRCLAMTFCVVLSHTIKSDTAG